MDPYIQIIYQGKKYRTKTIQEGGKKPVWNQTLFFDIFSLSEDTIKITCFDEDVIVDDLVGTETFSI